MREPASLQRAAAGDFVACSSPARMAMLVCIAVLFVAGGLWMVGAFGPPPTTSRYGPTVTLVMGWAGIVFFGFCGLVGLTRLFDTRELLRIGPAGICSIPWSDKTIPWSEIVEVKTLSIQRQKMIVLRLADPSRFPSKDGLSNLFAGLNRQMAGGDVSIGMVGTNRKFDEAMAAIHQFRREPPRPN